MISNALNTTMHWTRSLTASEWHPLVRSLARIGLGVMLGAGLPLLAAWLYVAQPLLPASASSVPVTVDPVRLQRHVRMLAETFAPRSEANPENLKRTAQYLRQEFSQAGARVSMQPVKVPGQVFDNVIARFGPEHGPRIVIGAHYDAYDEFPGADDNASGVAGLIELAHLLGRIELPLAVELVGYTLEEPPYFAGPHMGSAVHAQSLTAANVDVRMVIVLEMIGYFDHRAGTQNYPHRLLKPFYPSTGNYVVVVGKLDQRAALRTVKRAMTGATPLPVYSINAPRSMPGVDFSDHRNYWSRGYSAVMITDTAFYRNPHYHTPNDTEDQLDYQRMAQVVAGTYAAVLAVAGEIEASIAILK